MKTDLTRILSISGQSGLFHYVSQARNGVVVEALADGKRSSFGMTSKMTSLADISIYTDEEEVKLQQVFTNMKDIAHRSLLSNSIDEFELKTGKRTEGIVFSMQNFVSKLTGAIPKFIQGYVLKFLGFDQNIKHAANQTVINAQVATRFLKYRWHLFILGPAIGSALYLIVILFLKDDKEHTAEVERQLKEKRALAEQSA